MTPISAIPAAGNGGLPYVGGTTPDVTPLPIARIEMPEELNQPLSTASVQPSGDSFSSMLGQMVKDVNGEQTTANQAVGALESGQSVPLHKAVIAMEEANVSFQLMVEVRNRLMDAYQEIMRMQI